MTNKISHSGLFGYVKVDWNGSLRTDERFYYIKDHLGSTSQVIDESNMIVSARDYFPYGGILRGTIMGTPDEKYKFTEKERDNETVLDYFGSRYYDSDIGRWLAVDPLADKYPGWSPYNYCMNNPLNMIDPKWRKCCFNKRDR